MSQTTVDWKIVAEYDVAPRIMVYGNIQTGYIPFGYSPDAGDPADELKRSKLLAFSGGFKSRLLGNSLEINSEFFYYDYKNFQIGREPRLKSSHECAARMPSSDRKKKNTTK